MSCDIVKDLLPNYMDGLTSETSNKAVSDHLATCDACRDYYEKMQAKNSFTSEMTGQEIDYFLRIREGTARKIMIAMGTVALLITGTYEVYRNLYVYGRSAESDEVTVSLQESGNGSILVFESTKENRVLHVGYTESVPYEGDEPVLTLILVEYRRDPFRYQSEDMGMYPFTFSGEHSFTVGDQDHWFDRSELYYDEDDFIAVEFNDTIKTIRLSDLREGDISSLR